MIVGKEYIEWNSFVLGGLTGVVGIIVVMVILVAVLIINDKIRMRKLNKRMAQNRLLDISKSGKPNPELLHTKRQR